MAHSRDHPLSKGSKGVEEKPRDPPPSHSALFALGVFGIAALSYLSHGYVSHFVTSLFNPPVPEVIYHPAPAPDVPPVVDLGYASYRGLLNGSVPDVVSWLGVPYARPPRRFRAPQALDETPRVHEIERKESYPDFCVQGWSPWLGLDDRGGAGAEDCLVLNIYAPRGFSNTSSYPVLVYIHGGGFQPFDNWVQRSPTPFVAVSIYYRLSVLGFLASPDQPGKGIHAGPDPELLLNAAIHDQRMALKFIQRHICAFGGDPDRVTLMGQSAGASSVGFHLVAKPQEPNERLFHRVILQSWYRPPVPLPTERKRTLECLRQADAVKLMQAADEGMAKHLQDENWAWRPVIDGTLFPDHPSKLLQEKDVDVIVGLVPPPLVSRQRTYPNPGQSHTTHDAVTAGPGFGSFTRVVRATYPKLSVVDAQRLEKMYLDAGVAPENVVDFGIGEANFRCAVSTRSGIQISRMRAEQALDVCGRAGIWKPSLQLSRAGHSADNWILFEGTRSGANGTNTFNSLTPAQRALSDETIAYIVAFVATGDPNAPRPPSRLTDTIEHPSPIWPPHTSGKRMVFRAESGGTDKRGVKGGNYVEVFDEGEVERCGVWRSLDDAIQV
ncbi:hypothetical protein FRC10_007964 [Ceratobasidium sp. 414]|nr:hypothetical protein FRC10_007964 [Ceratobasidium sp. 414]